MVVSANGRELAVIPIVASRDIAKLTWGEIFLKYARMIFMKR